VGIWMSEYGTSRHFHHVSEFGRYWSLADID
jgi:hypothetical protein